MLVPLSWLQEYVDVSDIPLEDLRKKMSASGLAVERQHTVGDHIEHIVVGEIINKQRHPDSDHLWVCQVNIGKKLADRDPNDEILQAIQIVTGASNIFEGAKVPVILPGGELPDGTKIESSKLRGYDSQGMMCSEKELGLGEGHEGIMILGHDAHVGTSVTSYLGLPDIVFDIEITANRGDLLSIVGIAREVATLFGRALRLPQMKKLEIEGVASHAIHAEIVDSTKCNRFVAVAFDGFELKSAPVWMQQRLLRAGMRPINNLVDITNYVMLEMGQPTHAYDASQIENGSFVVRSARSDESLETLDGKNFHLSEEMLVIADSQKALGIAGIMGGQSSKITESTQSLILEAANFDPVNVRRTGMKLNIRTDAIVRFERGVDAELALPALERINYLLSEYAHAHVASSVVDVYPNQIGTQTVTLGSRKLATYLGQSLSLHDAEKILNGLGFETIGSVGEDSEWSLSVQVPSWRARDISIEEDLIEEVTRIYGYDNVPISTPIGQIPFVPSNKKLAVKKIALQSLKSSGFQEVLTYSFNSREQIELSGYSVEKALEMANPLSEEQRYLRMSLIPNLLWTVEKNKQAKNTLHLFELSSVYHNTLFDILPSDSVNLSLEPLYLSGVVAPVQYDFNEAYQCVRGTIDALFAEMRITSATYSNDQELLKKYPSYSLFHPGRVGGISLDGVNVIGLFGEVHPKVQEALSLKQTCFVFDMAFSPLVELTQPIAKYVPFSVYPETTEALSFIFSQDQPVGPIVDTIEKLDERIVSVAVGLPYRGDKIEAGKQAITFTVVFQSMSGAIKEKDAEQIRAKIVETLTAAFNATLRV